MRKIYGYILAMAIMCFSFNGCDFLEAPPTVEMNEDDVFADRTLCEKFITGIYAEGMPLGFSMDDSFTVRPLTEDPATRRNPEPNGTGIKAGTQTP